MYLNPATLRCTAAELSGRDAPPPFIPTPIIEQPDAVRSFLHLHRILEQRASPLEQESKTLFALVELMTRFAGPAPPVPHLRQARPEIECVREYLHDRCAENISLAHLSHLAGLSPFHLCRVFRARFGLPPHLYQLQCRVDRARRLLAEGRSVSEASLETGFYDQSHFTRVFRRFVGVTPAKYSSRARTYKTAPSHSV